MNSLSVRGLWDLVLCIFFEAWRAPKLGKFAALLGGLLAHANLGMPPSCIVPLAIWPWRWSAGVPDFVDAVVHDAPADAGMPTWALPVWGLTLKLHKDFMLLPPKKIDTQKVSVGLPDLFDWLQDAALWT